MEHKDLEELQEDKQMTDRSNEPYAKESDMELLITNMEKLLEVVEHQQSRIDILEEQMNKTKMFLINNISTIN